MQISWGKPRSLPRTPAGFTVLALDGYGLRDFLPARPTRAASYPVAVRQVAISFHASFRRSLAVPPLRFTRASPPSGCTGDFHPQAAGHARHTGWRVRATAFGGFGLDRLSLSRRGLARRSWLTMSGTAPLSTGATGIAPGRSLPPAARSVGSTDSSRGKAAGCLRGDVSFSPQAAATIQVRDSTRRPLGLRYPAGTSRGPATQARPVALEVTDDWPSASPSRTPRWTCSRHGSAICSMNCSGWCR